jgi:hypothetical protein
MIARTNAVIPCTPAADYTGLEGYFVKATGSGDTVTLCTGVTDSPLGVITEAPTDTGKLSVAILGGGLAGTVKVKVTATSPGTIVFGSPLELAAEDGTVKLGTGGASTVVAKALEAGAAGELIEAILLTTAGTLTIDKTYNTTCVSTAAGAVMSTTGQVQDSAGTALSGYFMVGLLYSEAANTGIPYDFGNPAAQAGSVIVKEHTADALIVVLTKSDGSWGVDNTFTSDDTGFVAAWVEGKTSASTVAVDVP